MNSMENNKKLGEYLKKRRTQKGISVEDMADALKITPANIMNIENGDFKAIGLGDIFVKAYIKSYITEIGESSEDVFASSFNQQYGHNITIKSSYTLLEKLGEGGMGLVFKADDVSIGRTVAVKQLHPYLMRIERLKKGFLNEAFITGRLEHPIFLLFMQLIKPRINIHWL